MSNELSTNSGVVGLRPQNMPELFKLAEMVSNSELCPKNYRGKQHDTSIAMMMGLEVGLNPMQAIQNIAVINGKPCIYGDAMLALVQNHSAFVSIDESFNDTEYSATCTVKRKGGSPHTVKFSKEDAAKANLLGKVGPWSNYPKRMMQMRARGFALRNQFADALLGLISAEEAEDMPIERDITPHQELPKIEVVADIKPTYSDEDFASKKPEWNKFLAKDGKNATGLINMLETKFTLSDQQKQEILSLEAA